MYRAETVFSVFSHFLLLLVKRTSSQPIWIFVIFGCNVNVCWIRSKSRNEQFENWFSQRSLQTFQNDITILVTRRNYSRHIRVISINSVFFKFKNPFKMTKCLNQWNDFKIIWIRTIDYRIELSLVESS